MARANGEEAGDNHPGEVEATASGDSMGSGPSVSVGAINGELQPMHQFSEMEGVFGMGASSSAATGSALGAASAVACAPGEAP